MANMTSSGGSNEQRGSPQSPSSMAEKVSTTASEATEQTIEHVQRTRERLATELAERRTQLAERIRDVSDALHGAGRKLGDDDMAAHLLAAAGDKVERAASYIESIDPGRVAGDLRELAQERPAWFFGGAFSLGLALGRFFISTAEQGTRRSENAPARTGLAGSSGAPAPGLQSNPMRRPSPGSQAPRGQTPSQGSAP